MAPSRVKVPGAVFREADLSLGLPLPLTNSDAPVETHP